MAVKSWKTSHFQLAGAAIGAITALVNGSDGNSLVREQDAFYGAIAQVLGGALGGAIILGSISGIRNLLMSKGTKEAA